MILVFSVAAGLNTLLPQEGKVTSTFSHSLKKKNGDKMDRNKNGEKNVLVRQ